MQLKVIVPGIAIALLNLAVPLRAQPLVVQVPGASDVQLASSTGTNAPKRADIVLRPGEALQFSASGEVNLDVRQASRTTLVGPDGGTQAYRPGRSFLCSGRGCIGNIWGRRGALIGVFMSSQSNVGGNLLADFYSAAEHLDLQEPLTGQPFLIGNGSTPGGVRRFIVVPRDADRLFLGVLDDDVSDNGGSYAVTINPVGTVRRLNANPLWVPATAQPLLAGATPGQNLGSGTFGLRDFAPLNSPFEVDIRELGPTLRIGSRGAIDLDAQRTGIGPGGRISEGQAFNSSDVPSGFSNLCSPIGALTGVFVGEEIRRTGNAFTSDFCSAPARNSDTISPMLQQFFYIGTGLNEAGEYRRITVPAGAKNLLLGIHSGRSQSAHDNQGWLMVTIVPSVGRIPVFQSNGITNGAGFGPAPVAAGSVVSIFGQNLAFRSEAAASVPLPRSLSEAVVWMNGLRVPLFSVGDGQINAQVPHELEGEREVQVVVSNGTAPGLPVTIPLARSRPGIFVYGERAGVVVNARTNRLVTVEEPARRGDTLIIYSTGLGVTTPRPATGAPASLTELSRIVTPVRVFIGGVPHDVAFAGLAPGFIGVNQINVQVRSEVPLGRTSLYVDAAAAESNRVDIVIEP
jgi:uncharacterized protein (TIGR03437 family)